MNRHHTTSGLELVPSVGLFGRETLKPTQDRFSKQASMKPIKSSSRHQSGVLL